MVDLIELPIDPIEIAEETPFLEKYFPNIFVKALVPLNPRRWPAFVAGSAMASDMPEFGDKIQTPFNFKILARIPEEERIEIIQTGFRLNQEGKISLKKYYESTQESSLFKLKGYSIKYETIRRTKLYQQLKP